MDGIIQIDASFVDKHNSFPELIAVLRNAFGSREIKVPPRHHHNFSNPGSNQETTLLLMPAWHPTKDAGVKVVTVSPNNTSVGLPSIHGIYLYMDATTGVLKAIIDGPELTAKRTAAVSALASTFLSIKKASSLLMIGTGKLSANLIKAHSSVRPIDTVYVWGRDIEKAIRVCNSLQDENFQISAINNIEDKIGEVDIISCATLSIDPLIIGKHLRAGQHVDLVGSYQPHAREADDMTVQKSSVFLDTYQSGLTESGDIVIPLQNGSLTKEDIKADLIELCSLESSGRTTEDEITLFKSVGHALEDLAAANYYYSKFNNEHL